MSKIYYTDDINFYNTKIVNGNAGTQIKRYEIVLKQFREEIKWWFSLLNDKPLFANYIKKPICIELYEYAHYLQLTKNSLCKITKIVNKYFEDSGRTPPIKKLDKSINKTLKRIKKRLKEPRNIFAAHRYIDKNGQFITINKIFSLITHISDTNLNKLKEDLFSCHDEIIKWINLNKKYFILSDIQK